MEISLTPWQEEIVFSPSRFGICNGGRRVGKSFLAQARIKIRCLSKAGHNAMVICPYNSQAEELFESLLSDDELSDHVARTKTRPSRVWFKNKSRCDLHSVQRSESIRGKGIDDLLVDESQDIPETAFWRVARPLLSDRRGSVLMLGQPRGADWRYRQFYLPGQARPGSSDNPLDGGVPRYVSWRIPSRLGPAFQSADGIAELEIARQQMSRFQYAVEYECEAMASPEAAFRPEDLAAITRGTAQKTPVEGAAYCIGFDIGRVRDPSAASCMRVSTGEIVHTERMPLGMSHDNQARRCSSLATFWNNALVVLDATGGGGGSRSPTDEIVRLYCQHVKNTKTVYLNPWNKQEIMLHLITEVEKKLIWIPADHRELHAEMGNYEAVKKAAHWQFSGIGGHGDDLVISLALSCWGRHKGWTHTGRGASLGALTH